MICTTCGVWYDPVRGCDHRIFTIIPNYICSNCGWKVRSGLDFGLNNLPPCSVCNSFMDAFRILTPKTEKEKNNG